MIFVSIDIFRDKYRLIAVDLTFQKTLNALAIREIVFQGVAGEADNTEKNTIHFFFKNQTKQSQKRTSKVL